MPGYDFDLFVIGAGSGGVRAARMSASFGARVAIAEELSARLRRAVDDAGHASYDVRVMHRDLGRE